MNKLTPTTTMLRPPTFPQSASTTPQAQVSRPNQDDPELSNLFNGQRPSSCAPSQQPSPDLVAAFPLEKSTFTTLSAGSFSEEDAKKAIDIFEQGLRPLGGPVTKTSTPSTIHGSILEVDKDTDKEEDELCKLGSAFAEMTVKHAIAPKHTRRYRLTTNPSVANWGLDTHRQKTPPSPQLQPLYTETKRALCKRKTTTDDLSAPLNSQSSANVKKRK